MFYALNKEKWISSFKAIKKFQKENNIKKIGHAGTLDPLAEGLLIVATDEDTKLLSYLTLQDKKYICKMQLFKHSNSYDIDIETISILPRFNIEQEDIEKAINILKKQTTQVPPVFSAKKINGKRAYELARQNKSVELKANPIKIYDLDLIQYDKNKGVIEFFAHVSKGTYIRSIVHDLANLLNTDAVMCELFRTATGNITLQKNQKNKQLNNFKDLFGINIHALNKEELITLQKTNTLGIIKGINQETLLAYQNEIVAIAKIYDDKTDIIKIFWPRLNKLSQ
ncbi:tRNA pseudouridine(55) synthase TruB [Mycoplasma phocoenae]|uniref:tRNA pseudouridine synthase B n=1 Tax=Mycoplasma phocoenae TaxID=754517 RepID=A0A858U7E7_9MOLU|nr:tRNA pseudouridine(55) synthase TruB [Mycoplasma phocoenae]QJG67185.1 tRNA pseudouridine(55) synthase TruB [Mycoplasma phocoenae]